MVQDSVRQAGWTEGNWHCNLSMMPLTRGCSLRRRKILRDCIGNVSGQQLSELGGGRLFERQRECGNSHLDWAVEIFEFGKAWTLAEPLTIAWTW